MKIKILATVIFALQIISLAYGQGRMSNGDYVRMYSALAVDKMKEYKIPASITLAQGILESGGGSSMLAVRGNNHFGIKCGSKWTGARIHKNDDEIGDCFRRYKSVEESYRDHSLFLTQNQRYASLFSLDLLDYKGWAKGLKLAGYATNPQYPQLLIKLIEDNELWKYDREGASGVARKVEGVWGVLAKGHNKGVKSGALAKINGVRYVVALDGDTFESISNRTGVNVMNLIRFNDLTSTVRLQAGISVYVQRKKNKSRGSYMYEVGKGETMHIVSQKFGVKLESLYKLNPDFRYKQPIMGTYLKLR